MRMRSFASCTKACTRTDGQLVRRRRFDRPAERVDGADRLPGLPLQRALALELADEELEARVIGAHRAHGVDRARETVDVLFHQGTLGLHEELVGDAVDAAAREAVGRIAREHGAIEFEGILSRRLDERALGQREPGGVEQLLHARVFGRSRRGDRARRQARSSRWRSGSRAPIP